MWFFAGWDRYVYQAEKLMNDNGFLLRFPRRCVQKEKCQIKIEKCTNKTIEKSHNRFKIKKKHFIQKILQKGKSG